MTLRREDIPVDRPTIIWADIVTLEGRLETKGHSFGITARQLNFAQNALIDTSGPEASPSFPAGDKASLGINQGDNGRNGDNGGQGAYAGSVLLIADTILGEISVFAPGGDGGDAQSGGDGAKGATAPPQPKKCRPGIQGGAGGRGGLAGKPGDGGPGARVQIYSSRNADSTPEFNVEGGKAGAQASHGNPGEGGDGGRGGEISYTLEPSSRN
ncbi:hypothetical protein [Noviluteimonas dokdonensis]|uniref:hypothetical protein n=1 Tax=Noviluteimonas dokdonensis TaxID=414050 RepID=UPI00126A7778|nr:hypothetical protein [Lysobacter dokdonensis]